MDSRKKLYLKNKLFFILAVIIFISLAFILINSRQFSLLVREKSAYAAEPDTGANAIKRISTRIDISLLSDKKFKALEDNLPRQVKIYQVGKVNIFEP